MNIIKKYTAIQICGSNVNDDFKVDLSYGRVEYNYSYRVTPETEHNTEEEALKWAYEQNKYANWLILPIIQFKY